MSATDRADEIDTNIAGLLCKVLDCLDLQHHLLDGQTVEDLKHWVISRSSCYIAARDAGLLDGLEQYGRPKSSAGLN
jgi:hypothetical protein